MTLHVYIDQNSTKKLLIGLEFDSLLALQPVFDAFKEKTGVKITEYDDATLGTDHVLLLTKLFHQHFKKVPANKQLMDFIFGIQDAASHNLLVHFVGE
jgi:hypothetical protein